MVNQPNFQIPDVINPDNTRCICLQIPDNDIWISNFVGILAQPTYWFNWQRTGDNSGKQCADVWTLLFDAIDWSNMSCCCDNPPAIYRYSDTGVYQRSTDGGATWSDAPDFDYRNTSTLFPPPAALGISTTKCQSADSAVYVIRTEIVQAMDDSFAAGQILALIAAVLLAVLSAGSLLAFTPLITAIGAAIIDVGVAATKAAFTDDVWNRLRCNVFCHMTTDDSTDAAGFDAILTQVTTDETGIVETVLYGIINAAGVVGINNMIRSNKGDPDADCSACCPDCSTDWDVMDGAHGTIINRGTGFLDIQAQAVGGNYYAIISTSDAALCCVIPLVEVLSGATPSLTSWTDCGTTPVIGVPEFTGLFPYGSGCVDYFQMQDASPFTIRIHFVSC